jgi:hypothetical protein
MKKSQNMLIWLSKMVFAQHFFGQFAEAGKRHKKKNPNACERRGL